ncbi:hypothetical protein SBV1_190003 [Verrucomicrobia bacterium]|nr:hypothetical protein SBV1_190003 [Verrucomicrobiota bacterium]
MNVADWFLVAEREPAPALHTQLKDHAAIAGKEDKNKKAKSKTNGPSTAEPAS